jgi:hypothetical protein
MPTPYPTLDDIEQLVSTHPDEWRTAIAQLETHYRRLWHTREWRELRSRLIKDRCDQCGSPSPPFTLQHLRKHPRPSTLLRAKTNSAFHDYRAVHPEQRPPQPTTPEGTKLLCPTCRQRAIPYKNTSKGYYCKPSPSNQNRPHQFPEPLTGPPELTRAQWDAWRTASDNAYQLHRAAWLTAHEAELGQETARQVLQNLRHYLTGEGTATYCKRCAYLADKRDVTLCAICHQHYHPREYATCYTCRPDAQPTTDRQAADQSPPGPPAHHAARTCNHHPTGLEAEYPAQTA